MNTEMQIAAEDAFEAIVNAFGVVAIMEGDRRETDSENARKMAMAVRCIVGSATSVDDPSNTITKTDGFQYEVKIGRPNWVDHFPPKVGDTLTIEGYPQLHTLLVVPSAYGWILTCRSKGALQ